MKLSEAILYPFALLYKAGVSVHNLLYRLKIYREISFDIPVIGVGNLSVGGTGKTPHVEYLTGLLKENYEVAILSRGYRRRTKGFLLAGDDSSARTIGDEPMQYHHKFPGVTVAVGEARVLAIPEMMLANPGIDVLLLDDAFQHRAVRPGLQILLTTYEKPFFKDYLLPAGRLRESRKGKSRADVIIVSKCPANISLSTMNEYREGISPGKEQQVFFSSIRYGRPVRIFTDEEEMLTPVSTVLLVTAIANDRPLVQYLQDKVKKVVRLAYADHHYFTVKDLDRIEEIFDNMEGENKWILTTEKDAMRLMEHTRRLKEKRLPLYYIPVKIEILKDKERFDRLVCDFIANFVPQKEF